MAMRCDLPVRFTIFLALSVGACAALAADGGDASKATSAPGNNGNRATATGSEVTVTKESGKKTKVDVKTLQADHSGKKRTGKASFYSRKFSGKKMADGTPMNPNSNVAASKTLPIGTKAKVTNLNTGQSAVVEIRDRGPYVKGRIVDLSPQTAKDIGAGKAGVVPVEVTPIEVPQPDGSVKAGAGAGGTPTGK